MTLTIEKALLNKLKINQLVTNLVVRDYLLDELLIVLHSYSRYGVVAAIQGL
jgi:hypothetical protein